MKKHFLKINKNNHILIIIFNQNPFNQLMPYEDMSKQMQDQINRLQQMRAQYQMISQQRQQVELRLREIDDALNELEKTDDKAEVYKSIGSILIKAKNKAEVTKDLKENKDTLELRKSTLEKQEGRTKEKMNELQSKVQNALSMSGEDSE